MKNWLLRNCVQINNYARISYRKITNMYVLESFYVLILKHFHEINCRQVYFVIMLFKNTLIYYFTFPTPLYGLNGLFIKNHYIFIKNSIG